jgi:hypothetical protein
VLTAVVILVGLWRRAGARSAGGLS